MPNSGGRRRSARPPETRRFVSGAVVFLGPADRRRCPPPILGFPSPHSGRIGPVREGALAGFASRSRVRRRSMAAPGRAATQRGSAALPAPSPARARPSAQFLLSAGKTPLCPLDTQRKRRN
ncbi:hypothetical protein MTO96_013415 [Rhipicephalus appendiculatus]